MRLTARRRSLTRNFATGGAIGLWPLSDRTAARLTNARIKEVALTGRMMRPFRKALGGCSASLNPVFQDHDRHRLRRPLAPPVGSALDRAI